MGIFNMFPFTNFQEKNLDWLTRKQGTIDSELETQSAKNAEQELEIAANTAKNAQQDSEISELSARVERISELSDPANRKFIFVGDSYNAGWTPDGTFQGWGERCINMLGLTLGTNAWNVSYGGAGFGFANTNPMSFYYQIKALGDSMTESQRNSITDIVIGGGRNDATMDSAVINNGITETGLYCKAAFPNARRWLFAIGWDGLNDIRLRLSKIYYENYSRSQQGYFTYHEIYRLLQQKQYMASDFKHPNSSGNYLLGIAICQYLVGGETTNNASRTVMRLNNDDKGYVYIEGNNVIVNFTEPFNYVLSNGLTKSFTDTGIILKNPYLYGVQTNSGFNFTTPGTLTTSGPVRYYNTFLNLKLILDQDTGDLHVYARHRCINESKTNYLDDSSITHMEINPCIVSLPIECA